MMEALEELLGDIVSHEETAEAIKLLAKSQVWNEYVKSHCKSYCMHIARTSD